MKLQPSAKRVAERVIHGASRERPADVLLGEQLRTVRGSSPAEARQTTRAVFSFFRWFGWLSRSQTLPQQIDLALELAERFAREPESFTDAELVAHSVPEWLRGEMEVTPAFARALQSEPKLWLRARPGQGGALAKKLGDCRLLAPDRLPETLEYTGQEDLFRTASFHAGEFEIQDLSSQVVGIVSAPEPGQTWWDACAGEGGKLLHLSDLMRNQGLIWASDRAPWRLARLKRRAARAKVFNYRAAVWDGGSRLPTRTKFDGVLVDAPCSGVGTWQRNPHARWSATPQDVRELAAVQRQLLVHAAEALKPGGRLVYAVCSLTRAETENVADALKKDVPALAPLRFKNPLAPGSAPGAQLTLTPQQFAGNGMFVAIWERTG